MRVKLLKDIPGYSAGFIDSPKDDGKLHRYGHKYEVSKLLESGWAEQVEELNLHKIRKELRVELFEDHTFTYFDEKIRDDLNACDSEDDPNNEIEWFSSYRIVKAVIEKLNGNWKNDSDTSYFISYQIGGCFNVEYSSTMVYTPIPYMKDRKTVEKVIELCEPELKVLFGVK